MKLFTTVHTESKNAHKEITYAGTHQLTPFAQTLPVMAVPYLVFFDPATTNFYQLRDMEQYRPGSELVEVVTE